MSYSLIKKLIGRTEWLVLSIITVGAFLIRAYDLGKQSLWIDEVYTLNGAMAVIKNVLPIMDSGNLYVNNFLSVYTSAVLMHLFAFDAFNPWLVRLPGVIFGTLIVVAIFYLARVMYRDNYLAVIASFVVAFSYSEIVWSRQVRGYAALSLFIIICVTYIWNYIYGSRSRYNLMLASLSMLIACLAHWVALAFVPAILIIIVLRKEIRSFSSEWSRLLFLLSLILIPYLFIAIFLTEKALLPRYLLFPFLPFYILAIVRIIYLGVRRFLCSSTISVQWGITFAVILAFASPVLSLVPHALYKINLISPQPEYNMLFRYILENRKPEDVIVSSHPPLVKVFLGESGLYLPSISQELAKPDYYSGVMPINTLKHLRQVIDNNHGFVIINGARFQEMNTNRMKYIVDNDDVRLVFYSQGQGFSDRVWLYRF